MNIGRFQCSMLDCIRSTEKAAADIVEHREENSRDLMAILRKRDTPLSSITFVGSGSSSTSAITARSYVEKVSGLHTELIYPNDFIYNTFVYDPDSLYVFISQTGTSIVTSQALEMIQEKGYDVLVISESRKTPLSLKAGNVMIMDCGIEEYPMRTVGYSATVMSCMILGLQIGLYYSHLSQGEYDTYIDRMRKIASRQSDVINKTLDWLELSRRKMLRSDLIVFTGADNLYGVSLEGAMKVWETLQTASVGYELEEGMHGPNYGYNFRHCVIVLDNGGREKDKARALARYMKEVWGNGFLIGPDPIDKEDLELPIDDTDTCCIDFATVVQTIAYKTAEYQGRDLYRHHDNSRMESYFKTHS